MSRYFTEDHEWIDLDGEVGTVGISEYAQGQLGDIVFVDVPEEGKQLTKGDEAAVVESVKAASDVYSPVSRATPRWSTNPASSTPTRKRKVGSTKSH